MRTICSLLSLCAAVGCGGQAPTTTHGERRVLTMRWGEYEAAGAALAAGSTSALRVARSGDAAQVLEVSSADPAVVAVPAQVKLSRPWFDLCLFPPCGPRVEGLLGLEARGPGSSRVELRANGELIDAVVLTVHQAAGLRLVPRGLEAFASWSAGKPGQPVTMAVGERLELAAVPHDAAGAPLAAAGPFTFESPSSTVSLADGLVTALSPGAAHLVGRFHERSATLDLIVVPER